MVTMLLTSEALLERLAICHREIAVAGVYCTATEHAAIDRLDVSMLPFVYLYQFGGMTEATPAQSAGHADITRRYVFRVLVSPAVLELPTAGVGSPGQDSAIPYIDAFASYYLAHPRLSTDGINVAALGGLALVQDVQFQDGGVRVLTAPGGAAFWGFDETLTITHRVKVSRVS